MQVESAESQERAFETFIDLAGGRLLGPVEHVRRTCADLAELFADQQALSQLVRNGNPIVYDVYVARVSHQAGRLLHGITTIYPGRVGREYFFTMGHYHRSPEASEVYVTIRGQGMLVLQRGELAEVLEMTPGKVWYVAPGWAHRTVNTSLSEPLVFFSVWPADAEHDYERLRREGIRRRVFDEGGRPVIVPA